MKKIISVSAMLFMLSIAVAFVQVGCQKVEASPSNQTTTQHLVLVYLGPNLVVMNHDGTGAKVVTIGLPSSEEVTKASLKLSSDATKIFFVSHDKISLADKNLYSCNVDGTGLAVLTPVTSTISLLDVK